MPLGYTNCSTSSGVVNIGSLTAPGKLIPDANNTTPAGAASTCVNVWGGSGSDVVTYSISDVAVGQLIDNAKFNEIGVKVNEERARRGHTARTYSFSGIIDDAHINALKQGINDAGYTAGFAGVSAGNTITALNINQMIDKVQAAGNVCVCNCNYCTCNCNYCTCNCNYSCTCNCNYSDERLKTEVSYL